jgi:hypothetical protein
MQRVRIGLTGLSCVFLLVLLAAAFLGFANSEADRAAPMTANAAAAEANSAAVPSDPLAELGVAPGNPLDRPESNSSDARAAR